MLGNFAHPCKILAHNFSSITSNFTDRSFKGTFTVWLKLGQIQMTVNSVLESVMLSIYFFFANFRSLGKANFKRLLKMVAPWCNSYHYSKECPQFFLINV